MALKFQVPKFITIEDKLAGMFTFKQLFALFGAFIVSYMGFRSDVLVGIVLALICFPLAILLTFVYINGKPFLSILPNFFEFVFGKRRFLWQKIDKIAYKEVAVEEDKLEKNDNLNSFYLESAKDIKSSVVDVKNDKMVMEITYPENISQQKEKVTLSLDMPIASQVENLHSYLHKHMRNPHNPYRLFPYIKFYRAMKKD